MAKKKPKYQPAKRTIEEVVLKPVQKWPAGWHHGKFFRVKKKFKKKKFRGLLVQPRRRAKDGKHMVMEVVLNKEMPGRTIVIHPKFVKELS